MKCGFGRFRDSSHLNANMYEGQYKNNMKNGFGIFKWGTGNLYIGHYVNDEREGIGQMTWCDGRMYIGEWKNGFQHGYGKFYSPDGNLKEGLFEKNVYMGKDSNIPKELLQNPFDIMK